MTREREFCEDKVLDAAMYLFWAKGYSGTSLQDLVEATGLKKPSIYNAFGNKRSLFGITLARYSQRIMGTWITIIEDAPTACEAVAQLLDAIVKQHFDAATPGGCLVGFAAQERDQHDAETRALVAKQFHQMDSAICARLTKGKADGELPDDLDPQGTSTAIVSICAGLLTLGRGDYSENALKRATESVINLLR